MSELLHPVPVQGLLTACQLSGFTINPSSTPDATVGDEGIEDFLSTFEAQKGEALLLSLDPSLPLPVNLRGREKTSTECHASNTDLGPMESREDREDWVLGIAPCGCFRRNYTREHPEYSINSPPKHVPTTARESVDWSEPTNGLAYDSKGDLASPPKHVPTSARESVDWSEPMNGLAYDAQGELASPTPAQ